MGECLASHMRYGELLARQNWVGCMDPEGLGNEMLDLAWAIKSIKKEIKNFQLILSDVLSDIDWESFHNECNKERDIYIEKTECAIAEEYKPVHAMYNEMALKVMTDKIIPDDVKFGLSLGYKFLFPFITTDENLHSVLAQLEDCIEQTIPEIFLGRVYRQIAEIMKKRDKIKYNDEIQWLSFISHRTKKFLKNNPDIFATRSDKGGHTVIIDVDKYDTEIGKLLDDAVYEKLHNSPLSCLVERESKFMKFFSNNEKTKENEQIMRYKRAFQPKVLHLARFYGLPKVHKKEFKLRPIMSLTNAPSFVTGKIFDYMLKTIFPRSNFHIKDSFELKRFIDKTKIGNDNVLVSFDVISMFTNIPRDLVKDIVLEKSNAFLELFGIGRRVLIHLLDFLLVESTVFTALENIYIQKEGLPMGSCISPTLARIVMDRVMIHLLQMVPEITFIKVFVDDTITAIPLNSVNKALETLNSFNRSIQFTCEMENDNKSIVFLNMTLHRNGRRISTCWYRKGFASGRLLNYMSSHKRTTVIETGINFILTVLALSNEEFFLSNRQNVIDTLRENSFPEIQIISLMNEYYSLMKIRANKRNKGKIFAIYPHAVCESKKVKRILHQYKEEGVVFSDSTRNSRVNHITTRKTEIPKRLKGNMIVISTCACKKKHKIVATQYNQTAKNVIDGIKTTFVRCTRNLHAFRRFKINNGLHYSSQTNILARYIQWKYRGSFLNTRTGRPEYHFAKLLPKK